MAGGPPALVLNEDTGLMILSGYQWCRKYKNKLILMDKNFKNIQIITNWRKYSVVYSTIWSVWGKRRINVDEEYNTSHYCDSNICRRTLKYFCLLWDECLSPSLPQPLSVSHTTTLCNIELLLYSAQCNSNSRSGQIVKHLNNHRISPQHHFYKNYGDY